MKIIVVFSLVVAFCYAAKLPEYFAKCSKSDSKLSKCLTDSANAGWPTMIKGDRAHHIQELVPFLVPFMRIEVDNNLQGNLTDAAITGLENTKFEEIEIDFTKKTIDVKFTIPRLNFAGAYEVTGKLLFLPLEGQGPANITFLDMVNDFHMQYDLKEKAGKQYIEVLETSMKYKTSRAHFRLDNLFGGDERLGEAMNHVLDESWEAVNEEIGVRVGEAIGAAYGSLLQSFFRRVAFNDFFSVQ